MKAGSGSPRPRDFPSSSAIDGDIVDRFCRHQTELIGHIRAIRSDLNPSNTIVTSPLLGFVTYTLEDALIFLPMHCQRHLGQAKEVGRAAGFPVTLR